MKQELTATQVRELMDYDKETGLFTWRVCFRGQAAGAVAGTMTKSGISGKMRRIITINGFKYVAARLAFLWVKGRWPKDGHDIDHIDRNPSNNQWANLREVTHGQNMYNRGANANGLINVRGVDYHCGKFRVRVNKDRKTVFQASFDTLEDAARAAKAAHAEHYGEFAA